MIVLCSQLAEAQPLTQTHNAECPLASEAAEANRTPEMWRPDLIWVALTELEILFTYYLLQVSLLLHMRAFLFDEY